jgi:hypothetical protein
MKYAVVFKEIVSARGIEHAIQLASARMEAMPASELEDWVWDVHPLPVEEQNWPTSQRVRNHRAKAKLFVERSGLRYPDHGIDD